MDGGPGSVAREQVHESHLGNAMSCHEALMSGRGMTGASLAGLGPLAVYIIDPQGWRSDALFALGRFLSLLLEQMPDDALPRRTASSTEVARVLRAALGIDHFPVSRSFAGSLMERPVGEGSVRNWENRFAQAAAPQANDLCQREWERLNSSRLSLPPARYPYWSADGDPSAWLCATQTSEISELLQERLNVLMGAHFPVLQPASAVSVLRECAVREAESYLNVDRHHKTSLLAHSHTERERPLRAAQRALGYLQHDVMPIWSPMGRLWLLSGQNVPLLMPSSYYRTAGRYYRESAAAALSRSLYSVLDQQERLLRAAAFHLAVQVLDSKTARPRRADSPHAAFLQPDARLQQAVSLMLSRTRSKDPQIATAPANDVFREDETVTIDELIKLAQLVRTQNRPEDKSTFIDVYLRKRVALPAHICQGREESRALALADQMVEWDMVCASKDTRAEGQLNELHRIRQQRPLPEHRAYATHRFRGWAIIHNKRNRQRTGLEWAMAGIHRLSELSQHQQIATDVELFESVHQHYLGLTGIWAKWLEKSLIHPHKASTPAWIFARHAHHWATLTMRHLEILDREYPLPAPQTGSRFQTHRISTTRWQVQTHMMYTRVQLAAYTAWKAQLGTRSDFTGEARDLTGRPLALDTLDLTAVSQSYYRLLELPDLSARADGCQLTQLALWLGLLDGGGLPTLNVETTPADKRNNLLQHLPFLFAPPHVLDAAQRRHGLPRMDLKPEPAAEYLREHGYDANILSKIPTPAQAQRQSAAWKVYQTLHRLNGDAFTLWRRSWDEARPQARP